MFSSQIDINLITPTGTLPNGLMAEDMLRLVQRGSSSEPVELTGLVQALHHTADDFQISASDQLHPTHMSLMLLTGLWSNGRSKDISSDKILKRCVHSTAIIN